MQRVVTKKVQVSRKEYQFYNRVLEDIQNAISEYERLFKVYGSESFENSEIADEKQEFKRYHSELSDRVQDLPNKTVKEPIDTEMVEERVEALRNDIKKMFKDLDAKENGEK